MVDVKHLSLWPILVSRNEVSLWLAHAEKLAMSRLLGTSWPIRVLIGLGLPLGLAPRHALGLAQFDGLGLLNLRHVPDVRWAPWELRSSSL